MTEVVTNGSQTGTYSVELTQKQDEWQDSEIKTSLGKVVTFDGVEPGSGKTATLTYDADTEVVTCTIG